MVAGVGGFTMSLSLYTARGAAKAGSAHRAVAVLDQRSELDRTRRDATEMLGAIQRLREALVDKRYGGTADRAAAVSSLSPALDPDSDPSELLEDIPSLSSVSAGTFTINDVELTVNPATQTLEVLLDTISASAAGVTAMVTTPGQIRIESDTAAGVVEIADGTSNLFGVLGIDDGFYKPKSNLDRHVTDALRELADAVNQLYGDGASGNTFHALRSDVQGIFTGFLDGSGPRYRTEFGLELYFPEPARGEASLSAQGQVALRRALRGDAGAVIDFFLEAPSSGESALLDQLVSRLTAAEADARTRLGSKGLVVDLVA